MDRRLFLTSLAACPVALAQGRDFTFEPSPAGKTLKGPNGRVLLSYLTEKPEGVPLAGNSVCCFHPLTTPTGETVTDIAPPDHRDHRGAFFAWGNMAFQRPAGEKTADFWGWGRYAPVGDRVILNRSLALTRSDSNFAEVVVRNDWMIEGEKVLDEVTTAQVRTSRDTNIYDLTFRFRSDQEFTVGQMAFTGFVVRCRKDGKSWVSNSRGPVDLPDSNPTKPELNWPAEDWYSYTIALESGKTVAVALIDHPANPKSTWHYTKTVSFLNPSVSAGGPVKVAKDRALTLRYRVLVRDGEFPAGAVNTFAKQFRAVESSE